MSPGAGQDGAPSVGRQLGPRRWAPARSVPLRRRRVGTAAWPPTAREVSRDADADEQGRGSFPPSSLSPAARAPLPSVPRSLTAAPAPHPRRRHLWGSVLKRHQRRVGKGSVTSTRFCHVAAVLRLCGFSTSHGKREPLCHPLAPSTERYGDRNDNRSPWAPAASQTRGTVSASRRAAKRDMALRPSEVITQFALESSKLHS